MSVLPVPDAEAAYRNLLGQVRSACQERSRPSCMIGVHSGGAWIAERLHADLSLDIELGFISSAFHRDDYGRGRRLPTASKSTEIAFDVAGADILLVDDILFTGRTVRAVLNELFDYGRPQRVRLAVLVDRGGRELPVQPDFCGVLHAIPVTSSFDFERSDDGHFTLAIE